MARGHRQTERHHTGEAHGPRAIDGIAHGRAGAKADGRLLRVSDEILAFIAVQHNHGFTRQAKPMSRQGS